MGLIKYPMQNETKKTISQMSAEEAWEEFCKRYNKTPIVQKLKKVTAETMARNLSETKSL